jgi:hypothetical protein
MILLFWVLGSGFWFWFWSMNLPPDDQPRCRPGHGGASWLPAAQVSAMENVVPMPPMLSAGRPRRRRAQEVTSS